MSASATLERAAHAPGPELAPHFVALGLTAAALLLAFPIVSFALTIFALINLPAGMPRYARLSLAMLAVLSFSMMMGARPLDPGASNDIDVYYELYEDLRGGDLEALFRFGSGFEVALPLIFYAWGLLLPHLSVNGLMFGVALTSSVLLVLWVEKAFYAERGWNDAALMGVCILMFNLYFATQLTRQFMSLVVLLYAFAAPTWRKQAVFVLLAATFHLTALPFFALYLLARRGRAGWIAIVLLAFAVRVLFWDLVAAFDILPVAVTDKLMYYLDNSQEFTESDIGSLRMIVLLALISLAAFAANRFRAEPQMRAWLAVPWITAVVHLLLLPIPLASLRTTLMVHSVAPGLIAYLMFARRAGLMLPVVLNVLLIYKITSFLAADQSGNLLSSMSMLSAVFL